MVVVLGIVIGFLILVALFLVVIEITLNNKVNVIQSMQRTLEREFNIAKDQYTREMRINNKEVAKELSKLERNSACFVGHSERVPVSILLFTLITYLGLDVTGREFKIIKKGDQGSGKESEVCKDKKAKKN